MNLIENFLDSDEFVYFTENKEKLYEIGKWRQPKINWLDKNKEKNIFSELIDIIHKKGEIDDSWIAGYEYWINPTQNSKLGWHVDCDEYYKKTFNKIINPKLSCVFYLIVDCDGGELDISSTIDWKEQPTIEETIIPKTNNIVLFDCKYVHKVRPFIGERFAISINFWEKKMPSLGLKL